MTHLALNKMCQRIRPRDTKNARRSDTPSPGVKPRISSMTSLLSTKPVDGCLHDRAGAALSQFDFESEIKIRFSFLFTKAKMQS